jgi:hypothetical protein
MVNCNPIVYIKHAWEATNTIWGKLCIVLFYTFLWFNIVASFIGIFYPRLGADCFYEGLSEYSAYLIALLNRQINLVAVGFLLYADRGGIRVWNVAMVFAVYLAVSVSLFQMVRDYPNLDGIPEDCPYGAFATFSWFLLIWSGLALLFSIMEVKLGRSNASTRSESTPLVA